jgi:hypothetical protein
MDETKILPLERVFRRKAQEKSELPYPNEDYFDRYSGIVNYLRDSIYPFIDAGLAALSEDDGIYTLHGPDHFDEVVRYAGHLLGCESGSESMNQLTAYELYVLLVAIRLHDAGNMFGREGHEKRAFQLLLQMGPLSGPDEFEKKFIAGIAEAHGGKTPTGDKDTISQLTESKTWGCIEIKPRVLAAIVRFADEICESRPRAAKVLLVNNALPRKNEIFHKYAECIKSVKVRTIEKAVEIQFAFMVGDALRKWGKGVAIHSIIDVFLIDEILDRLDKMFRERRYCARYMRGVCNVERIKASVEIFDSEYQTIKELEILSDEEGYPESTSSLTAKYISGSALEAELRSLIARNPE